MGNACCVAEGAAAHAPTLGETRAEFVPVQPSEPSRYPGFPAPPHAPLPLLECDQETPRTPTRTPLRAQLEEQLATSGSRTAPGTLRGDGVAEAAATPDGRARQATTLGASVRLGNLPDEHEDDDLE